MPGWAARDITAGGGLRTRRLYLPWSGRGDVSPLPRRLPRGLAAAGVRIHHGTHAGSCAADPTRSDPAYAVSGAELNCGNPWVSATLRFLLQGRVFPRRPQLLHAARG